jgi:hypothetical protein
MLIPSVILVQLELTYLLPLKCHCGIFSAILWISFVVAKVDVVHPVITSVLKKDMFIVQYAPTTIR